MKLVSATVLPLLAVLAAASPLLAQNPTSGGDSHVGFGASISNVSGTVAPVFIVPIDLMPHLRLEPEIGYSRTANEQTTQFPPPAFPSPIGTPIIASTTTKQKATSPSAGTGAFFVQLRDKLKIEYGARFGYTRTTTQFSTVTTTTMSRVATNNTTTKLAGYFVGPAIGGEYFFSDLFSLGAELQLRYISVDGHQEATVVPLVPPPPSVILPTPPRITTSQTTVQMRAAAVVRVYVK